MSEPKAMKPMTFTDNPTVQLYERLDFEVVECDVKAVYILKR